MTTLFGSKLVEIKLLESTNVVRELVTLEPTLVKENLLEPVLIEIFRKFQY